MNDAEHSGFVANVKFEINGQNGLARESKSGDFPLQIVHSSEATGVYHREPRNEYFPTPVISSE